MLSLNGNLCEIGDLDGLAEQRGLRIERPDGSVVQITGLTKGEVQGLDLFAEVTLAVVADGGKVPQPDERARIAAFVAAQIEWQPCDCGCPSARKPKSAADVKLARLAAGIRMGHHLEGAQALEDDAGTYMARHQRWPEGAAFTDLEGGFFDEQGKPLPQPTLAATAPPRSELEMLGYELDGVLADVKHGQGGALDPVCQQTVVRVSKRLHELGSQQRKGDPK